MAEYPNQDRRWPDKSHFEPYIQGRSGKGRVGNIASVNGFPRCQCWKTDRSQQCGKQALKGTTCCKTHGGGAVAVHREMKTRRDFLKALNEATDEQTKKSINEMGVGQLAAKVVSGDVVATKYWFDQQFGGPTSTIINEVVDRDLFARFVRATAAFIDPDKADEWLAALEQEIRADSESTTSPTLPGK